MTWGREREGLKIWRSIGNKRLLCDRNLQWMKIKEFPNYCTATALLKVSFKESKNPKQSCGLASGWGKKLPFQGHLQSSALQVLPFQIFFPLTKRGISSNPVLLCKHPFEMVSWRCSVEALLPCFMGLQKVFWDLCCYSEQQARC